MNKFDLEALLIWGEQQGSNLMEMGGPIMWPLLAVSLWLWTLVLERYWFIQFRLPWLVKHNELFHNLSNPTTVEFTEARLAIYRYLNLIKTLSGILPMLGLLGTVTGIVETFDLIRIFGNAETRIVARGVSQALITTLAGLVLGLFGLTASHDLNLRAQRSEHHLGLARGAL
ncbi:MAG: MotA/TolQ/ExbB proton channel family protein [Gammaproteobacteria bacterium]